MRRDYNYDPVHDDPNHPHEGDDMDELQMTVETLIDLDEPEALLETLKRAAVRKGGEKWRRLAQALKAAQDVYDKELAAPADATVNDETTRLWMEKQKPKPLGKAAFSYDDGVSLEPDAPGAETPVDDKAAKAE